MKRQSGTGTLTPADMRFPVQKYLDALLSNAKLYLRRGALSCV